jgi:hypothetical protein
MFIYIQNNLVLLVYCAALPLQHEYVPKLIISSQFLYWFAPGVYCYISLHQL